MSKLEVNFEDLNDREAIKIVDLPAGTIFRGAYPEYPEYNEVYILTSSTSGGQLIAVELSSGQSKWFDSDHYVEPVVSARLYVKV